MAPRGSAVRKVLGGRGRCGRGARPPGPPGVGGRLSGLERDLSLLAQAARRPDRVPRAAGGEPQPRLLRRGHHRLQDQVPQPAELGHDVLVGVRLLGLLAADVHPEREEPGRGPDVRLLPAPVGRGLSRRHRAAPRAQDRGGRLQGRGAPAHQHGVLQLQRRRERAQGSQALRLLSLARARRPLHTSSSRRAGTACTRTRPTTSRTWPTRITPTDARRPTRFRWPGSA